LCVPPKVPQYQVLFSFPLGKRGQPGAGRTASFRLKVFRSSSAPERCFCFFKRPRRSLVFDRGRRNFLPPRFALGRLTSFLVASVVDLIFQAPFFPLPVTVYDTIRRPMRAPTRAVSLTPLSFFFLSTPEFALDPLLPRFASGDSLLAKELFNFRKAFLSPLFSFSPVLRVSPPLFLSLLIIRHSFIVSFFLPASHLQRTRFILPFSRFLFRWDPLPFGAFLTSTFSSSRFGPLLCASGA